MRSRRVLVIGALGRMGERVRMAVREHPKLVLAAALEMAGHPRLGEELEPGIAVEEDAAAAFAACDVAIDFSVPAATLANLRLAADTGVALVTGTTGFAESELAEIAALAKRVPVVHAPNFSPAVNVLAHLVREAARLLGPDYDAEIVELHHAAKRDAPSGTALRLASAVSEGRDGDKHLVLARSGETGPRPRGSIGVQTLRGGDNPGEHSVLFVGRGDRVELIHRAHTRDHFARGAVAAAAWLAGRSPGLYPIERVLGIQ